ncbi:MAG: iron chaperone [Chitinophagales bacterium]
MAPKPTTIKNYIEAAPKAAQEKLWQLHEIIREAAPGAEEGLKWSMPAYSYQKILVTFAVFKHHIGFYPMPSAIKAFSGDLTKYKTAAGSVQFPLDQKLPVSLIRRIIKFRVKESREGTIKWKS